MFETLRRDIHDRLEKHRRRHLMDATAAACAYVAAVDDEVSLAESHRVDELIESLEQLKVFDPRDVKDRFDVFVAEYRENKASAQHNIMKEVRELKDDRTASALLVQICIAVSSADGALDPREEKAIREIADALEVDVPDIEEEILRDSIGA